MKVLSLFNGISCGRLALERAGINVSRYVSYEIDKFANSVAKKHFPNDEYNGDVCTADFAQYEGFDYVIGGSPCTYWSIAQKDREITCDGEGYRLFMEYARAVKESKCKWFLYENNFSIHKNIKEAISKELGVEPIMINSALMSAQSRKRCYWTNIPNVVQPNDQFVLVKDILENGQACAVAQQGKEFKGLREKSLCILARDHKGFGNQTMNAVIEKLAEKYGEVPIMFNPYNSAKIESKTPTLTTGSMTTSSCAVMLFKPVRVGQYGKGGQGGKTGLYKVDLPDGDYVIRKLSPVECERLQTVPDNFTMGVSNTQRYKLLGNGWTVNIIAHILSFSKTAEAAEQRLKAITQNEVRAEHC